MTTTQSQITEYNVTEAGLQALRERMEGVQYDLTTSKGMDAAKLDRRELVTLRTSLEKKRVELKAPALEHTRLIDAEAKRITAEIEKLENPIDEQIKKVEAEVAAAKAEKVRVEAIRVSNITAKIQAIKDAPIQYINATALVISDEIGLLEGFIPSSDEYQEFIDTAKQATEHSIAKMRELLGVAIAREKQAKELAAERERLAQEKRKADALEQTRLLEAKAVRDAEITEAKRLQEIEAKKLSDERRALEAEKEAAHDAEVIRQADAAKLAETEAQRIAHEQSKIAAERLVIEQEKAALEAARIATLPKLAKQVIFRPSDAEILDALCDYFGRNETEVIEWLEAMNFKLLKETASA